MSKIAPRPGGHFTHAEASYRSAYGKVESRWERENGKTVYSVTVPANCTAEIRLPAGYVQTVKAGSYQICEE